MHSRRIVAGRLAKVLILAWPLTLWGADREAREPKAPLARLEVQPGRIDWLTDRGDESLILTIAGPGNLYIQRKFASHETPSFSSADVKDGRFPDGIYAYELRGEGPAKNPFVQSGQLWVQGGNFMDPAPIRPNATQGETTTIPDNLVVVGNACIGPGCGAGDANTSVLKLKTLFDTQILFENSGCCVPYSRSWSLQANDGNITSSGDFLIRDVTANTIPVRFGAAAPSNTIATLWNGNVGLGTSTPANHLHVFGSAGTNKVLVEETGSTAAREMLEIRNKGGSVMIFEDTTVPERWGNGTFGSSFVIDNQANAGIEFLLTNTGNLTVSGTVTPMSSREVKQGFDGIDRDMVLDRVLALPITTWAYKADPNVRHMGPMAEDFFSAFNLGPDDKGISVTDSAGVAFAAIQGLYHEIEHKNAALTARNAELEGRLATLEKMVQELAAKRN